MPLVQITAVGGLIKPVDSDRYRPYVRGDQVSVSEQDASRLVAQGVGLLVGNGLVADNAELEQPDGGVVFDPDWSLPVLRKFANARRIALRDSRSKALVIEDIQAALPEPDENEDD